MTSLDNGQDKKAKLSQLRAYSRDDSIVFYKTKEAFGGLSNMASGYPLSVNGIFIPSSEALYQACRFPHLPQVQREIIQQPTPMYAKRVSEDWRSESREDWIRVRVNVMRWCLRVKACQNQDSFCTLLLSSNQKQIVELSRKDDFWGALENDDGELVGRNVLGRLLMELREDLRRDIAQINEVRPADIENFLLLGRKIETVTQTVNLIQNSQPKLC
ncbi:NADAR family protein [Solilutibacter silvestris]|uniref:NADAR family protein n=1 Tax=Solilutibacter silvestris TaxID=1645665 RepID=UPI003D358DB0